MSTFLGILKEYPNLSVDYFRDKALETDVGAYFLSHCHTDHMHGLKNPAFENRLKLGGRQSTHLYLSKISQTFLENDAKYKHLKPYMVALPVNEPVTISLFPSEDPEKSKEVVVTLLQAGHCPGSVMFLFEGKNGRVLYTGDFRLTLSDLESTSFLLDELGEKKKIDNLYIDTTFCKPDAFYIPDRNDSLTAALDIIKPWLKDKGNYVRIICSAQYGYERFFIGLNESLGTKIHVNDAKFHRYDGVPEIQNVLTILPHESQIHACTWSKSGQKTESDDEADDVSASYKLPCGYKPDTQMRVLHIKLSAMWYTQHVSIKEISCRTNDCNFYRVCYSMHSSLEELRDFVLYTQPVSITPNVVPKGVDSGTLVKWLRNPLPKSEPEVGVESPPLLGHLKLPLITKSIDTIGNVVTSPEKSIYNSSQESKENYESELDLSGVEDNGPMYIKKTPVHNPCSPEWCFEMTPEKDALRVPSRLSETSDIPLKIRRNSTLDEAQNVQSQSSEVSASPGDSGLKDSQNMLESQVSELSSTADDPVLQETQNFELDEVSGLHSTTGKNGPRETEKLELEKDANLSSTEKMDLNEVAETICNLVSVADHLERPEGQVTTNALELRKLSPLNNNNTSRSGDGVKIGGEILITENGCLDALVSNNVELSDEISTTENGSNLRLNQMSTLISMANNHEIPSTTTEKPDEEESIAAQNGNNSEVDGGENLPVTEVLNGKDNEEAQEPEKRVEIDAARGLDGSDSSLTSDGNSLDKSENRKENDIYLSLAEGPSDSGSWSEDSRAIDTSTLNLQKRSRDDNLDVPSKPKRSKHADPFMSNYQNDLEQKRPGNPLNNGHTSGSPDELSEDSDSVVECYESDEEYDSESNDQVKSTPVNRRTSFEVVDLSSSDSVSNLNDGFSDEDSDNSNRGDGTVATSGYPQSDSDATPEKIVNENGDVNRAQNSLFPQNDSDVEVITLD